MKSFFSTEGLAQQDALGYWRDAVCSTFAEIECRPLSDLAFRARLSDVDLSGIHFCDVSASPIEVVKNDWLVKRACHDNFMLCIQQMGRCVVEQDGEVAQLMPDDLVLLDSARTYRIEFPVPFRQLVVHLPRSELLGESMAAERRCGMRILGTAGTAPMVRRFLAQMADHLQQRETIQSTDSDLSLRSATLSLIEGVLRTSGKVPPGAQRKNMLWHRAMDLMTMDSGNPALTVVTISEALGVSERRLQQVFQQRGESLSRCLWRLRLERSKEALDDHSGPERSIGEIALMVGFNSFSHFSRSFRDAYGCTPRDYRLASNCEPAGRQVLPLSRANRS